MIRETFARIRDLMHRRRLDAELREELRFHAQMLARDGASPARLGNATTIHEETRAMWSFHWLESVVGDARFALRSYRRSPGFTVVVLATLALGIGASTAVFGAVDGILLRPLPFPDSHRLLAVWPSRVASPAEYEYLLANAKSYDGGIAVFSPGWGSVVTQAGGATQVSGGRTSPNLFRVLGAKPLLGRTFADGESGPSAPAVVVLSWGLWSSEFGGDSSVVGRTVSVDGTPTQIIGVMPRDFSFLQANAELWMPLQMNPASSFYRGGTGHLVGRLRNGATAEGATAELRAFAPRMREQFQYDDKYGNDVGVTSLHAHIVGPIRTTLFVLLGAVACLLLIAAANVANLLIGRAMVRRDEIALRMALGASRQRAFRQLLVESLVLSIGGGVFGMFAAVLGVRAIRAMIPANMPRAEAITVDLRVLAIATLATVVVGVAFGLLPALLASRDSQNELRSSRSSSARIGRRIRFGLVLAETAMAFVLVIGAGLMAETMWRLSHVDPGFRADHVVTLRIQPSGPEFPSVASRVQYYDDVVNAVRSIPGVTNVGGIQHLPLSQFDWHRDTEIEGKPQPVGAPPFRPGYRMILDDYLGAMRIPVIAGRAFTIADDTSHAGVVLINEAFAKLHFPGENPLGRRIRPQRSDWVTIVGVVGDVRHVAVTTPAEPEMFVPIRQVLQSQLQIVARTSGDPVAASRPIFERVVSLNRAVPVSNLRTLESHASISVAQPRVIMALMISFAVVGLILVAVGIYGVVAYAVESRRREVSIRVALGARSGSVLVMLLREGVASAAIGVVVGIAGALALSNAMRTLVFEVSPTDVSTYVGVAIGLLSVATLASWIPARRAVKADPIHVLRAD